MQLSDEQIEVLDRIGPELEKYRKLLDNSKGKEGHYINIIEEDLKYLEKTTGEERKFYLDGIKKRLERLKEIGKEETPKKMEKIKYNPARGFSKNVSPEDVELLENDPILYENVKRNELERIRRDINKKRGRRRFKRTKTVFSWIKESFPTSPRVIWSPGFDINEYMGSACSFQIGEPGEEETLKKEAKLTLIYDTKDKAVDIFAESHPGIDSKTIKYYIGLASDELYREAEIGMPPGQGEERKKTEELKKKEEIGETRFLEGWGKTWDHEHAKVALDIVAQLIQKDGYNCLFKDAYDITGQIVGRSVYYVKDKLNGFEDIKAEKKSYAEEIGERKWQKISKEQLEIILKGYRRGMTPKKTAELAGVTKEAVKYRWKKESLKPRRVEEKQRASKKKPETGPKKEIIESPPEKMEKEPKIYPDSISTGIPGEQDVTRELKAVKSSEVYGSVPLKRGETKRDEKYDKYKRDSNVKTDDILVNLDMLAKAIENIADVDIEEAKRDAGRVMDFFWPYDRIIDNALRPEDRQLFYILEEAGMLTTEREEDIIYDGREWRTHYWLIMGDMIKKHAEGKKIRNLLSYRITEEDMFNLSAEEVYESVEDKVWKRKTNTATSG